MKSTSALPQSFPWVVILCSITLGWTTPTTQTPQPTTPTTMMMMTTGALDLGPSEKSESEPVSWTSCQSTPLTNYLREIAQNYSHITRLDSIGKSIEGRDLWVMVISDSPTERPLLRPQVKFVGNVNGFSGPSCYVLLRLIDGLVQGYERENSLERKLIQSNEIHILPNMNPDGFRRSAPGVCDTGLGRYNAEGKELNRDFPDIFNLIEDHISQPETKAIMKWIESNNFVISTSYITGARVVSYPFDSIPFHDFGSTKSDSAVEPHLPPDHDVFKHLATTFVQNVDVNLGKMTQSSLNPQSSSPLSSPVPPSSSSSSIWHCPALQRTFPDGIINGAEWMPVSGTMLDYNYLEGTFELLVGITCCRNEDKEKILEKIWLTNKMAMLKMIEEAEFGVRGQVLDADTYAPLAQAQMRKLYQNFRLNEGVVPMPWRVSSQGEFWRPLLPGKYFMEVQMPGYHEAKIPFEVHPLKSTLLIIKLDKEEPETTQAPQMEIPNDIITSNGSLDEELRHSDITGLEMGDQSHSVELFNETQPRLSKQATQESDSKISDTPGSKSWTSHYGENSSRSQSMELTIVKAFICSAVIWIVNVLSQ